MEEDNDKYEAFCQLFEAHYGELRRYACRITGDEAEADDVVEDTFAELWQNRHRLDFDGNIRNYLYRAVYSNAIQALRRRGVSEVRISLLDSLNESRMEYMMSHPAIGEMESRELREELQRAIASLPEKCRMAFQLSYIHRLRNREIAEMMGVSVRTVEAHIYKALHDLREKLRGSLALILLITTFFAS